MLMSWMGVMVVCRNCSYATVFACTLVGDQSSRACSKAFNYRADC
jgi:hypothetical protein